MNNDVNLLHTMDDDITFERVRHMPRRTQFVSRHRKLTWQHDKDLKKHERDRKLSDVEMSRAHVTMTEKLNRLQDAQKKMARRKSDPWATAIGPNRYYSHTSAQPGRTLSTDLQIRTLVPSTKMTGSDRTKECQSLSFSADLKNGTPAPSTKTTNGDGMKQTQSFSFSADLKNGTPAPSTKTTNSHGISCVVPDATVAVPPPWQDGGKEQAKGSRPKKIVVAKVPSM